MSGSEVIFKMSFTPLSFFQCATKKRPSQPPSLLGKDPKSEENTKLKGMLAEQLAKVLLKKNMGGISEYALHCLGKLSSKLINN